MLTTMKSKKFKVVAFILAFVIALTCMMWKATEANAKEIKIDHANISGYNLFGSTDAVSAGGLLVGTEDSPIALSVYMKSSTSNDSYSNIRWSHNGTNWSSDTPVLYAGSGSTQQIAAFYPYQSDATNEHLIDLSDALDQSTVVPTDYLYSEYTQISGKSVTLTMKHACTKLIVVPKFGSEVSGDTIAKIEVQNMHRKAILDLDTLNLTYPDGAGGNTYTYTLLESGNGNYEALVIPFACTSFPIVVTMASGRVFTTTIHTVDGELAMGTCYTINLQIGQDNVVSADITVEAWVDVDAGNLETE